ncbi:uncharacterized protein N7515_005661 [Penicillium bovifimosum]|uniref:Uncharacterized protein n=1 Tax=Penicillium bovifimosum TaxID=126998 RepID=A0A9W9GTD7_9EURO|nr:uncharacterized protein N7515_005661 [Penicillium bovifimosum]KAJ5129622.1 hypothetical protein N7515_005661 [Penicillium bovifimosum]
MSFIRQSFAHPAVRRQLRPGAVGLRSSRPNTIQRSYATDAPGGGGPAKNQRLALVAVGLGVPIAFYLFNRSPANQAGVPTGGGRGANQEYTKHAEGNKGSSTSRHGPPGGTGSISSKQQGLSNTDTMNPYVNEPGKSQKGEGETESVKVKGTVTPDRPQK